MTKGFANELNQVIINILNNSRDAIILNSSENKTIFVKTYNMKNNSILSITDCAGGIPKNIIDNMFDAYVTTKNDSGGTGIGLDMSKAIIEKVNGTIEASNVITKIDGIDYKGACFTILLNDKGIQNG